MHNFRPKAGRMLAALAMVAALTSCTLFEPGTGPTDPTNPAPTPNIDATRNAQFAALATADAAQIVNTTTPAPQSTPTQQPSPTAPGQTLNVFVTPIEAVEVEAGQ